MAPFASQRLKLSVLVCIVHLVLPFSIELRTGLPVHRQVILAVHRALVSGQLRGGDSFPSVRELSKQLRINPNTAHKAVATLKAEGVLAVRPGIGTVIASEPPLDENRRRELLGDRCERLVVEARHLGLELIELEAAITRHWQALEPETEPRAPRRKKRSS